MAEVVKLGAVRQGSAKGKQNPYTTTISKTDEGWKRSLVALKHKHSLKSDVDILSFLWNTVADKAPELIPTNDERALVTFREDGTCHVTDTPLEVIESAEEEDTEEESEEDETTEEIEEDKEV